MGTLSVLICDTTRAPVRQLLSSYSMNYDATQPENIVCKSGNANYTVYQAMAACGFSGSLFNLSDGGLLLYDQGSNTANLDWADQLTLTPGQALVTPGKTKPLVGSGGVTVTSNPTNVTISSPAATSITNTPESGGYLYDTLTAKPRAVFGLPCCPRPTLGPA